MKRLKQNLILITDFLKNVLNKSTSERKRYEKKSFTCNTLICPLFSDEVFLNDFFIFGAQNFWPVDSSALIAVIRNKEIDF